MNLFVYGTLCVPEVVARLIGRELPGEPAALPGFQRALLQDCVFPGIVRKAEQRVEGTVFRDIDDDTLAHFDAYEAPFYERVTVTLEDGSKAEVYELPEPEAWRMSEIPWDEAVFRRDHLAKYLW